MLLIKNILCNVEMLLQNSLIDLCANKVNNKTES